MADTVTFRDRTYGAGDLLTAMATFAAAQDDAGATDFLCALPDGLKPKAAQVLGEMIARGRPDDISFAAAQVGYVGGIAMADLLAALRRDDLRDPDARLRIASQIAREIFDRGASYDEWLRTQAGRAEYGWSLTPVFLVRDRAWALAHLDVVLGGSDVDASIGFRMAVSKLDAAGQKALAADVRANTSKLSPTIRDTLAEDLKELGL